MRRRRFLSISGLALVGCAAGARSRPAPREARGLPASEPMVRIGLQVGVARTTFQPLGGRYLVRELRGDAPIAVIGAGETWGAALDGPGVLRVVDPRGWLSRPHERALRVEALEAGTLLRVEDRAVGGDLEVVAGPQGVTVINELPLEAYLPGVLTREMGDAGAGEALRAQAVAARTYALKRLGSRAELGFDLYGDVQDQAYGGEHGRTPAADDAVRSTRGRVLLAGGHLIDAFYHSTCGGSTAAVDDAFPRPPVPYLASVSDGDGEGGYHCDGSRYFRWRAGYDAAQLERLLARNLARFVAVPSGGAGEVVDLTVVETSAEGRVRALRVETTSGRFQVTRNDVRWLFADSDSPGLRSTLFLLRKERRRGRVERVELTGGGWGHGVGMCQVGTIDRAAAGAGHEEILVHYYPGTRVEGVYA